MEGRLWIPCEDRQRACGAQPHNAWSSEPIQGHGNVQSSNDARIRFFQDSLWWDNKMGQAGLIGQVTSGLPVPRGEPGHAAQQPLSRAKEERGRGTGRRSGESPVSGGMKHARDLSSQRMSTKSRQTVWTARPSGRSGKCSRGRLPVAPAESLAREWFLPRNDPGLVSTWSQRDRCYEAAGSRLPRSSCGGSNCNRHLPTKNFTGK